METCKICGKDTTKTYKENVKFEIDCLTIIFENTTILECTSCNESFIDQKQNVHVQQWLKKIGHFKQLSNSEIIIKIK